MRRRPVEGLGHAVEHDQLWPAVTAHHQGPQRRIGHPACRIPRIREKNVQQLAGRSNLADVERHPRRRMQERALAEEPCRDICFYLCAALCQGDPAGGHDDVHQDRNHHRHDEPEIEDGPCQAPGRKSCGLHHDQFAFARQAVRHIDRRRKGRNGQNQADDIRQRQGGEFKEDQGRLAVADQLVEQAHGTVDPVDRHKNQREKTEQGQKLRQQVSVESGQGADPPGAYDG